MAILTRRDAIRFLIAVLLAAMMVGCGGKVALKPMWTRCPSNYIAYPSWSPDSTQIAYFESGLPSSEATPYIVNLVTGSKTRIAASIPEYADTPVFSPDGSQLLTSYSIDDQSHFELVTVNLHGTKHLLIGPTSDLLRRYEWSSDGDRIAVNYLVFNEPRNDLVVLDEQGELDWRLSEEHPEIINVSAMGWSPSGNQLAFAGGTTGINTVFIFTAQGDYLKQYSVPGYDIDQIQWSPNGEWIAMSVRTGDLYALNVIKSDGTEQRILGAEYKDTWVDFQWLSNSKSILIVREDKSRDDEIVALSIDGSSQTVLSIGDFVGGTFSPDGTMIAYLSVQNLVLDVYVMNVDGTDVQQITDNPGNHKCFQWPF
jgi:Tol biopolymer transport system component